MAINEPSLVQTQFSHSISWGMLRTVREHIDIFVALTVGCIIWHLPPAPPIGQTGMHFLATLAVAVWFWVRETFEEYVVGLLLLCSWVIFGIVSSKVALSGFAENSWLFVIAALGLGAAVNGTGLLSRLSAQVLRRVPLSFYRTHVLLVMTTGLFTTPLLPTGKARTVIGLPLAQAILDASGFRPRSNGSAALTLAALVGFSQLSFVFLTGGEFCLIGWNLLPGGAKSEFGWLSWFVAALPAGVLLLSFVFLAIHFFFPLGSEEKDQIANLAPQSELKESKPLSQAEWIIVITLTLTITGWLTMPIHGVNEAWIGLAALLVFLVTGVLNKDTFTRRLDWGLILFFGVVNSMGTISSHLKVDQWFVGHIAPLFLENSFGPFAFLAIVVVLVNLARLLVRKSMVVTFFVVTMVPIAQGLGIHPGAFLLTVIMASEGFFLAYQDGPYQIAYSSTQGQAFSHAQARKLLLAKSVGTLLVIALSVPYWSFLGWIR
jgi:DASS family divalent anion:Na+ symporter